ncbi:Fibronectin type 3 domain-containing protein [Tenacibaculum sp. 190524A02b]
MIKKFKMKRILFLVLIVSYCNSLLAQKELGNKLPEVKVIGTATKNKIMLRWGVTTPTAWKYANKYGYTIERKTIVRNQVVLSTPEIKQIVSTPLKPKPMMEWKEFTEKNMNAAIAAQALYGDQFEVNMNEGGNGILSIINQAQVLEQRFTFALYAADQDFEVAKFSGLAYIDNTVKPNERYLYSVKVALPKEKKIKVKHGGVYIGLEDYKPLPKPQEFVGVFKDKTAILSWNFAILKKYYTNYIIEKSEDGGKQFKSLSKTPIVNMSEKEKSTSNRMMYVDSLFQNNKEYKYRIKGVSPFGIQGPYSDIISGKGKIPLIHNPFITEIKLLEDGNAMLQWEFPSEGMQALKSFKLVRANQVKGNYTIVSNTISKNSRSFKVENLQAINYYKVIAVGTDGSSRESFPKMVQPDDVTPPETPSLLKGTIDSLGVVRLEWKQNKEIDFHGYRVFRANLKNDEFTQVTFRPIPNSKIIDTINIKTLNKHIYYKIQAFDKRYNPSEFSEVLELKRPDIVPPTPPVFTAFNVKEGKVDLEWITSSSSDAQSTVLYRKEKGGKLPWELIKVLELPLNKFTDESGIEGKTYLYTAITVDESGLESDPITPLKIKVFNNSPKPMIKRFYGEVNRTEKKIDLRWNYEESNVVEFILYKATEGKTPTMYKIFKSKTNKFIDKNLTVNTKYIYLLQAVFNTGAKSPLKKIELNY